MLVWSFCIGGRYVSFSFLDVLFIFFFSFEEPTLGAGLLALLARPSMPVIRLQTHLPPFPLLDLKVYPFLCPHS